MFLEDRAKLDEENIDACTYYLKLYSYLSLLLCTHLTHKLWPSYKWQFYFLFDLYRAYHHQKDRLLVAINQRTKKPKIHCPLYKDIRKCCPHDGDNTKNMVNLGGRLQ